MREIKFRVWNELHNRYEYWGFIDGTFTAPPNGFGLIYLEENSEQYTGLKDIFTEIECYEGDIIEWIEWIGTEREKVLRFVVKYEGGSFVGERTDKPNMTYQLAILLCQTMHSQSGKIIGNIHKNQVLL